MLSKDIDKQADAFAGVDSLLPIRDALQIFEMVIELLEKNYIISPLIIHLNISILIVICLSEYCLYILILPYRDNVYKSL
jgi:hypothetical protein